MWDVDLELALRAEGALEVTLRLHFVAGSWFRARVDDCLGPIDLEQALGKMPKC
jgi:hypothetical protein